MCCKWNLSYCEHCSEVNKVTEHTLAGGKHSTYICNHKNEILNEKNIGADTFIL